MFPYCFALKHAALSFYPKMIIVVQSHQYNKENKTTVS